MPIQHIDRDEYEVTIAELANRAERRDGDAVVITGQHEDQGRMTLRREAGSITLETEPVG